MARFPFALVIRHPELQFFIQPVPPAPRPIIEISDLFCRTDLARSCCRTDPVAVSEADTQEVVVYPKERKHPSPFNKVREICTGM